MGSYKDNDRLTSNGLESFAGKLWTKIKSSFLGKNDKAASAGNADTVNGKTVAADVPEDAAFTDTTYTAADAIHISENNVISIQVDNSNFSNDIDGDRTLHLNFGPNEYTSLAAVIADMKTKQETVNESGENTKTITNISQNENGEITVNFEEINFDGVVPNLDVSTQEIDGGTEVTIKTMKGSEEVSSNYFDVWNGNDGADGEQGDPGLPALICTQVNETSLYNGGYTEIPESSFNRTPVEGDVFFIHYASNGDEYGNRPRYGIQRCVVDSYNEEDKTWKVYTYDSHDFPLIQGPQGEQGEGGVGVTVSEISNGIMFDGETGEASITAVPAGEEDRGSGVTLTVGSTVLSIEGGKDGNTIIKYSNTVFMYDESQPVFTGLKPDNSKIGDLVVWSDDDGTYISQITRYGTYGSGSSQVAYGDAKTLISGAEGKSIRNIGKQSLVTFDDRDTKTFGSIASDIFGNINVGETIVFNYQDNEYIATITSITENERYGFVANFNNCSCISGNLSGTYVPFEYNPSVISSNSPASDCKTYWENMENGVKIVYNNLGTEYTLIFSKQGEYGTILRYSYSSFYFEILQKTNKGWNQENWGKMDADVANKVDHSLSLGGKTFNGSADVSVTFRDIMPTNSNYDFQITNQCVHMFTTPTITSGTRGKFGTFMYTFRDSSNIPRYGIVNLYWDASAGQMRLYDYVYGNSDSSSGAIFFIRKNSNNSYNIYCKTSNSYAYLSYALVTSSWAADIHNSETTDTTNLVPETISSGINVVAASAPGSDNNTVYLV